VRKAGHAEASLSLVAIALVNSATADQEREGPRRVLLSDWGSQAVRERARRRGWIWGETRHAAPGRSSALRPFRDGVDRPDR
jgi:hypothetical protein